MECNFYTVWLVFGIYDCLPCNCRHQCRDALLPVDQDFATSCEIPILRLKFWTLPKNNISRRIATKERVNQFFDLCFTPYKWTLNLWYGDITLIYIAEYGGNAQRRRIMVFRRCNVLFFLSYLLDDSEQIAMRACAG